MADCRDGKGRVPGAYSEVARRPRVRLLEVTVTAEKPNLWKWHVFERDVEVMHGHETSRGMHRSYSGIRRTPSAPRSAVVQRLLQSCFITPICLCDWREEVLLIWMRSRGVIWVLPRAMNDALSCRFAER